MPALRWWPRTVTRESYRPVSWRLNCANLAAHKLSQRALSREQPTWHQRACLRFWRGDKLCSLLKSSFVPTCHSANCRKLASHWPWSSCQIFQTVRRTQLPPPGRHRARHRRHMQNDLHGEGASGVCPLCAGGHAPSHVTATPL